uniref:ATP synthase subunit a n=1 Tax=Epitonium scalare TaxID=494602 RepID=A0A6B9MNT7_9CAEN|nr:ATP synthase F0 subunit 6 [Epitonium scalare]
MLLDIFSSFDDNNQVFLSLYFLNWLMSLSFLGMFSVVYWVNGSQWSSIVEELKLVGGAQVTRGPGIKMAGLLNGVSSLFLFIILMNLMGLIPYVFSTTSHLGVSLVLGFPMWLMLIISSAQYNFKAFIASFLPMGAPALLNPFLVIIEVVSIAVRPLTLSVRLMANMSAGHIVLTIIGSYLMVSMLSSGSFMSMLFLSGMQIFYTIFEFGIAVIQAYIFCLLISLYFDDHSSK